MDNDIRQFDNINNKVVDDLKCTIQKDGNIAVAAACFSLELGCDKGNNLCQVEMKLPAPFADKYMSEFDEL